jgi:hypothetical protein
MRGDGLEVPARLCQQSAPAQDFDKRCSTSLPPRARAAVRSDATPSKLLQATSLPEAAAYGPQARGLAARMGPRCQQLSPALFLASDLLLSLEKGESAPGAGLCVRRLGLDDHTAHGLVWDDIASHTWLRRFEVFFLLLEEYRHG